MWESSIYPIIREIAKKAGFKDMNEESLEKIEDLFDDLTQELITLSQKSIEEDMPKQPTLFDLDLYTKYIQNEDIQILDDKVIMYMSNQRSLMEWFSSYLSLEQELEMRDDFLLGSYGKTYGSFVDWIKETSIRYKVSFDLYRVSSILIETINRDDSIQNKIKIGYKNKIMDMLYNADSVRDYLETLNTLEILVNRGQLTCRDIPIEYKIGSNEKNAYKTAIDFRFLIWLRNNELSDVLDMIKEYEGRDYTYRPLVNLLQAYQAGYEDSILKPSN